MKKLLCVDGNSILNRAFYGIRPLSAHDGTPTNAVYGMVNILYRHISELAPDYFIVAFDVHAPTFRHNFYSEYKAGRHETPPELLAQFASAKECITAMGGKCVEISGYEADDILGAYAKLCTDAGIETYIVTGDRDSLQLISDSTTVLLATTGESVRFDRNAFFEKYGIYPEQHVDMKALMGDPSDNIPGVSGIGEKTAGKLIAQFGSLDALYDGIDDKDIAAGTKNKLIAGHDFAYLSQKLARINCEVPSLPPLDEAVYAGPDRKALSALFARLDFNGLIKRFGLEGNPAEAGTTVPAARAADESAVAVGGKLGCCFDFEGDKFYLSDGGVTEYAGIKEHKALLCGGAEIICCDVKSLYHKLEEYGMDFSSCKDDVMLMGYVCSKSETDFTLGKMVQRVFGTEIKSKSEEAYYVLKLYELFSEELKKTGQEKLYREIEFPLAHVLYEMERDGFMVDTARLKEFSEQLGEAQKKLGRKVCEQVGYEFNINSPKQLGEALFVKLGLPAKKKTKSGYSTNADALEALRPYTPVIDDVIEYRTLGKLKSTYADGLAEAADANGRVHTSFRQALTATGRLSSFEPNLQNIPIRTELGRQFRKYFIASDERHVLVDADYSQIELRLLAAISGDETMREAFLTGHDIHSATAMRIFGVSKNEVTIEMRKRAKAINFGIMYGMGDFSLASDLHIPRSQAAQYIDNYMTTYPKIKAYLADVVAKAKEDGFVSTLFGRRRYIPELSSRKHFEVAFGERVARNSPIQGTAADIIKLAMVNAYKRLKESGMDAKLILQVHDELVLEASRDCAEEAKKILREEMENAVSLSVPLTVDIKSGDNWFSAH